MAAPSLGAARCCACASRRACIRSTHVRISFDCCAFLEVSRYRAHASRALALRPSCGFLTTGDSAGPLSNLFYGHPAQNGAWFGSGDLAARVSLGIIHLHEKPTRRRRSDPRESITSLEFLSFEPNLDSALSKCVLDWDFLSALFIQISVRSRIPNNHRSSAILAFRNNTFKLAVLHRVVFRRHGESFVFGICRWPFRYCPRLQYTSGFNSKIVMKSSGIVFLDHKDRPFL